MNRCFGARESHKTSGLRWCVAALCCALSFLGSAPLFGATKPPRSLSFLDHGATLQLTHIEGQKYRLGDTGVLVYRSNRLVVKGISGLTKEQVGRFNPAVGQVTLLYRAAEFVYYRVELKPPADLQPLIDQLSSRPEILLVQPDLLQLKAYHGHPSGGKKQADFVRQLGIRELWKSTQGEGVKIAVIDDGFKLSHEDLAGVKLAFGYNVETKTLDPSPLSPKEKHGTSVVGVLFAQHNKLGVRGIAPKAELVAIRQTDTWTSNSLLSFYLVKLAQADVLNCSWQSPILLQPVQEVIKDLVRTGRQGKGMAVVFSAGNQGKLLKPASTEASMVEVITVGAVDAKGKRLKLSNFGPLVEVYTFGQNIWTTDADLTKKYKGFTGTSLSAAIVSGLIALDLSLDKNLSLAQIRKRLKQRLDGR